MSAVKAAAEALEAALKNVEGVAVSRDLSATLATPALVLGPPQLDWEAGFVGPTSARFIVFVVVDPDERAIERLWLLVEAVAEAIDATPAVVVSAAPAVYVSTTGDLPAYEIIVEMTL